MLQRILRRRRKLTVEQVRAHSVYALLAAAASDHARDTVPPAAILADPAAAIRRARHQRARSNELVAAAVMLALSRGLSWQQIADGVGHDEAWTRAHYGPLYQRWRAGEVVPWRVVADAAGLPDAPDAAATEVDLWLTSCPRRRWPSGARPFSGALGEEARPQPRGFAGTAG